MAGAGPFFLVGLWVFGKLDEMGKLPDTAFAALLELGGVGLLSYFLYRTGQDWYKQGKHRSAPSAESLMSKDPRPPVLYLRSFQDDPIAAQGKLQYSIPGPQGSQPLSWVAETEEEQLAQVMNEIGPFVALGRPGEMLPEIGAARTYTSNDEWQSKVLNLMGQAKMIVLRAGDTPSFLWEFEAVTKHAKPESVIVLLPYGAPYYNAFRRKIERRLSSLPFSLPNFVSETPKGNRLSRWLNGRNRSDDGSSISGVLYFEPNWRPQLLELKGFGAQIPNPLAEALKITLEPVFKQLGVPWTKPKKWFRRRYRA
jgi:hypothetical protein